MSIPSHRLESRFERREPALRSVQNTSTPHYLCSTPTKESSSGTIRSGAALQVQQMHNVIHLSCAMMRNYASSAKHRSVWPSKSPTLLGTRKSSSSSSCWAKASSVWFISALTDSMAAFTPSREVSNRSLEAHSRRRHSTKFTLMLCWVNTTMSFAITLLGRRTITC